MAFIKKWGLTLISFVGGACALILSLLSGMEVGMAYGSSKEVETTKAYKVITDKDLVDMSKYYGLEKEFNIMKICSIILFVIAALLVIYAIISLLTNLNVLKIKSSVMTGIGISLIFLLVVIALGVLGTSMNYAKGMENYIAEYLKSLGAYGEGMEGIAKVGVYQPLVVLISILVGISMAIIGIAKFLSPEPVKPAQVNE